MPPFDTLDPNSCLSKEELSRLLKYGLRICYAKRWVCEWLFDNITSTTIRTDHIVPPNAFDHGIHVSVIACISIPGSGEPLRNVTGNMVYIPMAHLDDITIGYAFTFQVGEDIDCGLSSDLPFQTPFIARFAFDHRAGGDLIFTTYGGTPKRIGISCGLFGNPGSEQYTFVVPSADYTWDNLPDDPILVTQSFERAPPGSPISNGDSGDENSHTSEKDRTKESQGIPDSIRSAWEDMNNLSSTFDNIDEDPTSDLPPLNSDLASEMLSSNDQNADSISPASTNQINEISVSSNLNKRKKEDTSLLDSTVSTLSRTPWMISSEGQVSDGIFSLGMGGGTETSSGMFDMTTLDECIQNIEAAVINRSFGIGRRLDTIQEQPTLPAGMRIEFQIADNYIQNILKKNCIQVYYDVILSVGADHRLLQSAAPKRLKKLAPRPDDVPITSNRNLLTNGKANKIEKDSCACGQLNCPCMAARAAKKAKILEERKKRNRLSAARSNEKRKQKLKAMQQDLEESQQKMSTLKEKQQQIMKENEHLKNRLASNTTTA